MYFSTVTKYLYVVSFHLAFFYFLKLNIWRRILVSLQSDNAAINSTLADEQTEAKRAQGSSGQLSGDGGAFKAPQMAVGERTLRQSSRSAFDR